MSQLCRMEFTTVVRIVATIAFANLTKWTKCGLFVKAPVAQLDRALPSGGRGQRFESSRAHHLHSLRRRKDQFNHLSNS